MKKPRVSDFDPNALERKLKSPLEGMPAIQKPPQKINDSNPLPETVVKQEKPANQAKGSPLPVPPRLPHTSEMKRAIRTRHPFDIYEDQYIELRNLCLQLQMQGIKCSMSQMVREALDSYLLTKKKEL
jgi:hypothetical protein